MEELPDDMTYQLLKGGKTVGQYIISYETAQSWSLTGRVDASQLKAPQAAEGATLYLVVCDDVGTPRKIWCGTFENGTARIENIPVSYLGEMRSIYILDQQLIPLTDAA